MHIRKNVLPKVAGGDGYLNFQNLTELPRNNKNKKSLILGLVVSWTTRGVQSVWWHGEAAIQWLVQKYCQPMSAPWWANVFDVGPPWSRHWPSFLFGLNAVDCTLWIKREVALRLVREPSAAVAYVLTPSVAHRVNVHNAHFPISSLPLVPVFSDPSSCDTRLGSEHKGDPTEHNHYGYNTRWCSHSLLLYECWGTSRFLPIFSVL